MRMRGKVYLVGAGPGDGGLLTVKGKQLIESAEVVVFDRLVGKEVLDLIPEEAEKIDVGKNAGSHPTPQHRINEILLEKALEGKKVVRLKGGDPFVFGRGGEELELLKEKGVPFEVVPGITSSVSAPAYAGIPVTHRDFCSSLHIITGHARAGAELSIDFPALVKLNGTLVFMMSVSSVEKIADGLLQAGMDPSMPCAVIERGTLPSQRKFVADLENISSVVRDNKVISPAVIMVGRVCALSDEFDWFDELPLKGKKVLVTQPRGRSSKMADGLRALGAEVTIRPSIETSPIRPLKIPKGDFDTLVFTSAQGVTSYMDWLIENGKDARSLADKKIACIGSATAKALEGYGMLADFVPSVFSGKVLGEEMVESGFVNGSSSLLLLRTDAASEDLTDVLEKNNIPFVDYPVYSTRVLKEQVFDEEGPFDLVTFTSRSCVTGLVHGEEGKDFSGVRALCIGEQTAEEAGRHGFDVTVSEEATIESMLEKALDMYR